MVSVAFTAATVALFCGISILLVLTPQPADALAELKALPVYPQASSVYFSDNTRSHKIGVETWGIKDGDIIASDRQRNLDLTVATVTFETSTDANCVLDFYDAQLSERGYWEVAVRPPGRRYLRWDNPSILFTEILEVVLGREVNHPITFYDLKVGAIQASESYTTSTVTRVSIELTILDETGGLR